jgi:twitching motility protein PilT
MICTPAISALIREGKIHQIYSLLQAGHKHGMQTMNQALVNLVNRREIAYDVAISRSPDARELAGMLGRTAAAA